VLSNILKKNDTSSYAPPASTPPPSRTYAEESTPSVQVKEIKPAPVDRTTTVLTAETEFNGTLGFNGDLEIYGRLEGAIESENGLLTIGESAVIKALVKAQNIIIYGKVQGDIVALGRIELRGRAQVYGDVKTGRLIVEDGVTFVGRSENMSPKNEEKPDFDHIFNKLGTTSTQGSKTETKVEKPPLK